MPERRRLAMSQPIVTVIGNVATQPRVTPTRQGKPATMFRVAHTERRLNRRTGRWEDGETSWYRVVVWREWCQNVARSMKAGDPVIVVGRLRIRDWSRDGRSGTDAEIEAIGIGHDLRRGHAQFTKIKIERPEPADDDESLHEMYRRDDEEFAARRNGADDGDGDGDGDGDAYPVAEPADTEVPLGQSGADDGAPVERRAA
jgi:single-strand DNA-binding protein